MDILKKRFARFSGEGDDKFEEGFVNQDISSENGIDQTEEKLPESRRGFFSRLASFVLLATFFVLPILFLPVKFADFLFTKQLVFVTAIVFAVVVWLFKMLKEGVYEFPTSRIYIVSGLIVVATFVSAIFSDVPTVSLIGKGFEVGTLTAVLIGFLTVLIIPLYFRTKGKIFSVYTVLFCSFAIVSLFGISRFIFGPDFLSFGILTSMASNILGRWNDLGVFFGLTSVLSLVTLEFFSLSGKLIKFLSYFTLAVSIFFLAVINFSEVWFVLGLFSAILFVYLFSFSKSKLSEEDDDSVSKRRRFPAVTFAVVVISLLFVLVGGYVSSSLSTKFGIAQIEARPSWQSTLFIAKETLKDDPVFGVGPNRFTAEWLLHKDPTVNSTIFWNSDFSYGVGLIPTYLVTTGFSGIIFWILFLGLFLSAGFRAMFILSKDKTLHYLTISSFLGALFLWIFNVIYAPGNVIVAFTFVFTGLFFASLAEEGVISIKRISYTNSAKSSFVSALLIMFFIVVLVGIEYVTVERYVSYAYFNQGLSDININGKADQAEAKFLRASSFSRVDMFYRALTETGILRMNNLLNNSTKNISVETLRSEFQNILGGALSYAGEATKIDPTNYMNWIERGRVYEAVVPLDIAGAYDAARAAYEEALKYNPHNPLIYLMIARLEYTKGDNVKAKDFVAKALAEKNNYIDAIFLLSQIQIKDGDLKSAISSVEAASVLSPNDPSVFFQLGLLKYNNNDWKGATSAFEQAVSLSPVYANAKYFLGLSYSKLGRKKDAIAEFDDLKKTNPDNTEIDLILSNLNAGKEPFTNSAPSINSNPAKGTKPPLEEQTSTEQ